jgi:hypothetical protein
VTLRFHARDKRRQIDADSHSHRHLATVNRRNLQRGVPQYVVRLLITVAILAVASMGYQFGINQKRQFATTCLLMLVWTLSIVLILDIDGARNGTVRVSPDPLIWTMESWDGGAS